MDAAVHLPLIDFDGEGFSYQRLAGTVDAAREYGFAAISANDHFVFSAPWLDGPTALAAVAGRSGGMKLVTTLALASLRGTVPLAKALLGAGHPLRRPRDRGRWPGLVPGRLRGGGSAVRATVAAFRRGGPAAQALAAAGSGRGQRRVPRHAGGGAVPAAAAKRRDPAVDRKLGL